MALVALDRAIAAFPRPFPERLRQDAAQCLQHVPTLRPEPCTAVRNNQSFQALRLHGTVPMFHMGNTYNIPLEIIITPFEYSRSAPVVRVTPVPGMYIPARHRFVDANGIVSHYYLHRWSVESNLDQLVRLLSDEFGKEPPVVSQPPPGPPPPAYATSVPPPAYRPAPSEEPDKTRLINIVTGKIKRRLGDDFLPGFQHEFDDASVAQSQLETGQEEIQRTLQRLAAQRDELVRAKSVLEERKAAAARWLALDQARPGPDVVVQAANVWSAQQLEAVAEANAIEDALYLLEKCLGKESIDIRLFLRQVRDLNREHFFKVALSLKVLEAQRRR